MHHECKKSLHHEMRVIRTEPIQLMQLSLSVSLVLRWAGLHPMSPKRIHFNGYNDFNYNQEKASK